MKFDPADRILLLAIPSEERLKWFASQVPDGALVAMGQTDESVFATRESCREVLNAMIHPGNPEEIPWGEASFHHVIVEASLCPAMALKEIWRVLLPDGSLWIIAGSETLRFQRKS